MKEDHKRLRGVSCSVYGKAKRSPELQSVFVFNSFVISLLFAVFPRRFVVSYS